MESQSKTSSYFSQSDQYFNQQNPSTTSQNQCIENDFQSINQDQEIYKTLFNLEKEFLQEQNEEFDKQQQESSQDNQNSQLVMQQQETSNQDATSTTQSNQLSKTQSNQEQEEEKINEEDINELLLSGGAFSIAFLQGYLQALMEIVGKEKLKKFKLGGVSCGAPTAVCLHSCIHSDLDMRFFYQNYIRKYYEKENRKYYGFFTSRKIIYDQSEAFYNIMKEYNIPSLNGRLHIGMSIRDGMFSLKKLIVDKYEDSVDFANAIVGTTMVPMFIGLQIFSQFRGMKAIDGGLTCPIPYKYKNSKKIFLNILPKITRQWPLARDIPQNCEYIDIGETSNLKFPQDYYLWDSDWADEQFYKGYLKGLDSRGEIKEVFDKF